MCINYSHINHIQELKMMEGEDHVEEVSSEEYKLIRNSEAWKMTELQYV